MDWNFDISNAPRGKHVMQTRKVKNGTAEVSVFQPDKLIIATKCGVVTLSHFIPDQKRWNMLSEGEQPVAWMAWPEHPGA